MYWVLVGGGEGGWRGEGLESPSSEGRREGGDKEADMSVQGFYRARDASRMLQIRRGERASKRREHDRLRGWLLATQDQLPVRPHAADRRATRLLATIIGEPDDGDYQ